MKQRRSGFYGMLEGLAISFLQPMVAEEVYPGADESSPSRSHYFSWINNTNEGPAPGQTEANLAFFQWMKDEYGMVLDIYAFDAGAIDAPRYYGKPTTRKFKGQFPNGFGPLADQAKGFGGRIGVELPRKSGGVMLSDGRLVLS